MAVVQNPDGQIAYIEKYNMYKTEETQTEPVHIIINTETEYIPIETHDTSEQLQKHSNFIKCICLADVLITAINIGLQYPYGIVICLISVCGYQGAVQYNKQYLIIYSIFQYIKMISKVIIMVYIIQTGYLVILIASSAFDIYILNQCTQFIRLIQ